ncbi:hypothetical protein SCOR_30195 [Sulfidibacter corallicola]
MVIKIHLELQDLIKVKKVKQRNKLFYTTLIFQHINNPYFPVV